jgi:hypothetical protein
VHVSYATRAACSSRTKAPDSQGAASATCGRAATTSFSQGPAAFQLAGVTHFVRNAQEPLRFDGPTPSRTAIDDLWLWRATNAFPRSWLVHRAPMMSDDEAFAELGRSPVASMTVAPVDRAVSVAPAPEGCSSTIVTRDERPELVTQQLVACSPGVVVLADAWFPGWSVDVDGTEADVLRTWGFLRGVVVPKGEHRVTWRYDPWTFRLGAGLSSVAWLSFAWVLLRRRRGASI